MESDAKSVSGLNQFNPQIRLTYRQFIFDTKKYNIRNKNNQSNQVKK